VGVLKLERNQKRASVNGCSAIVKRERVLNHARFGSTTESVQLPCREAAAPAWPATRHS